MFRYFEMDLSIILTVDHVSKKNFRRSQRNIEKPRKGPIKTSKNPFRLVPWNQEQLCGKLQIIQCHVEG